MPHPEDNVEAENQILNDDADLRSLVSVPRHRLHSERFTIKTSKEAD